jgi:hypothetical protein
VSANVDPCAKRKAEIAAADAKTENTFKVVAEEWIRLNSANETTHRALQNCGRVFRHAVATGRADRDPSRDLTGALVPVVSSHHASITDPEWFGKLLNDIDGYSGGLIVRFALKLAPLVFVRPGELRQAEWSEIDFEKAEWHIPAAKMKMKVLHIVPPAKQALALLRELQPYTQRHKHTFVFPSERSWMRPMSNNTVNAGSAAPRHPDQQECAPVTFGRGQQHSARGIRVAAGCDAGIFCADGVARRILDGRNDRGRHGRPVVHDAVELEQRRHDPREPSCRCGHFQPSDGIWCHSVRTPAISGADAAMR